MKELKEDVEFVGHFSKEQWDLIEEALGEINGIKKISSDMYRGVAFHTDQHTFSLKKTVSCDDTSYSCTVECVRSVVRGDGPTLEDAFKGACQACIELGQGAIITSLSLSNLIK